MPYADNNGVKIHYHVEGEGPPLVLQHGFSGSLRSWCDSGYVETLKRDHTLILADTRGHGNSDKPQSPEDYTMELKVADVTAIMDDLGVERAVYMGYSLGGRAGFGVAKYAPERFDAIVIGGMHPYGRSGADGSIDKRIEALEGGMESYVAQIEEQSGPMEPDRRARMLKNDAQALIASSIELRDFQGIEEVLPSMTMPCLLYVGEADFLYDGVKECVKHMPNATFVSFPGLDHGQTSRSSNLVLPHVTEFLSKVREGAAAAN